MEGVRIFDSEMCLGSKISSKNVKEGSNKIIKTSFFKLFFWKKISIFRISENFDISKISIFQKFSFSRIFLNYIFENFLKIPIFRKSNFFENFRKIIFFWKFWFFENFIFQKFSLNIGLYIFFEKISEEVFDSKLPWIKVVDNLKRNNLRPISQLTGDLTCRYAIAYTGMEFSTKITKIEFLTKITEMEFSTKVTEREFLTKITKLEFSTKITKL